MRIVPVVLAAGESRRMGYPKALLPLCDGTFLTHILATLIDAGLSEPRIILNEQVAFLLQRGARFAGRVLVNPDPGRGQLSSMQLAVASLETDAGACMFWPVDQPAVSSSLICSLVSLFHDSGALIAMPRCAGRGGHPVIFHHRLFQELMDAQLDHGAKPVVMRHQRETALWETDEEAVIRDIDTPEDYKQLTGETIEAALARVTQPSSG